MSDQVYTCTGRGGNSGGGFKGGGKSAKKFDKSEKDAIIDFESNKNELEKDIADGKLSTKLDKKA